MLLIALGAGYSSIYGRVWAPHFERCRYASESCSECEARALIKLSSVLTSGGLYDKHEQEELSDFTELIVELWYFQR